MKNLQVNLKKTIDLSYPIQIGIGFLKDMGKILKDKYPAFHYIIISDSNVAPLHASTIKKSLESENQKTTTLTFPAGEQYKIRKTKSDLEDQMISLNLMRDTCLLAVGGGVVGDLAGFVAATYTRGIPFIQFPTTLLAQVDSSIGGKTAVDTESGKNLIGAFYQPKAVFIDVITLHTLNDKWKLNGIAEIIKHAIIMDKHYFEFLEKNVNEIKNLDNDIIVQTVMESCKIKSTVVENDEKENGLRKILNFGHTIGHAVEALSNFQLSHNDCICIGIYQESRLAEKLGLISRQELEKIKNLLIQFDQPVSIPEHIKADMILNKTKLDKKTAKGKPLYSLPRQLGQCKFNIEINDKDILDILNTSA